MEKFRVIFCNIFKYDSFIYRIAARMLDGVSIIYSEGLNGFWQFKQIMAMSGSQGNKSLNLSKLEHPITVRPQTKDISSIIANCVREEYGQFERGFNAEFIIDAGAYIGDTSAYFLSRFPSAQVVALEPNDDSYAQLVLNLRRYGDRATLYKAALWNEIGQVSFGGIQTGASIGGGGGVVDTTTIPALLIRLNKSTVDILKMDIEGAEREVLRSGDRNWLTNVRLLLLETHGDEIEHEVMPLLKSNGFMCRRFRNAWYCNNERYS